MPDTVNLATDATDAWLMQCLTELQRRGFIGPFTIDEPNRTDVMGQNLDALRLALLNAPLVLRATVAAARCQHQDLPSMASVLLVLAAHLEAGHELNAAGEWLVPDRPLSRVAFVFRRTLARTARKIAIRQLL